MAEVEVAPFTFKGAVELDGNGYTAHITEATLTPTASSSVIKDINGDPHPFGSKSTWVLGGTAFQDVTTLNSFTDFTLVNDGELVDGTMTVNGKQYAFQVTIAATALGGTPDTPATSSFSFQATTPTPVVAP